MADRRMPTVARPWALKATYRVANAYRGPGSQWECTSLESEEKEDSSMRSLSGQVLQPTYAVSEAYTAQVLHAVEADQINWKQRLAGTAPVRSKGLAPPVRTAHNQLQGPDQHAHPPLAIASHLWDSHQ